MWRGLVRTLERARRRLRARREERQTLRARARFWAEVRSGEQEAAASSRQRTERIEP